MTIWAPDLQRRPGPRYLAIADALAADAAAGKLRAGSRLPTHRDLADRLQVTVGTVTRAYAEAARRGLVSGEVGRGTFVRAPARAATAPPAEDPDLVDLTANLPPETPKDGEPAALAATLGRLARDKKLERLLAYPPEGGAREHREAGAEWARRSGMPAAPERVLVSSGSQHGMTAVFTALFTAGDVIATEALTYPGMKTLAALLSLRLQGVALDDEGLRPDALAALCRTRPPRALYCVPTLQNPTSALMSEARRKEIAAIAGEHGVLIVEDDVHGRLLDGRRPRPLSSFAPERSLYLTGTSKVLAPGLRVGFVVAPEDIAPRIAAAIRGTTWMAAPLMAEIAARWIRDGTAEAILAGKRKEAALRQKLAARVLGTAGVQTHPAAYHLWLRLPRPWRSDAFVEAARQRSVAVTPAAAFAVGKVAAPEGVRVCLGAARDRAELERGLAVLADLVAGGPETRVPTGP